MYSAMYKEHDAVGRGGSRAQTSSREARAKERAEMEKEKSGRWQVLCKEKLGRRKERKRKKKRS